MKLPQELLNDPSVQQAVTELKDLIRQHYPNVTFELGYGEELTVFM